MEELEPGGYAAMYALEGHVRKTPLKLAYKELIKIRASQINQCAYCIEMHTTDARKRGESESRIYALNAWRESPLFSNEERALLLLTEEVTLISGRGLSDETYAQLQKYFDDVTIAHAILQVVTINAWNRIAVSSRLMHPHQLKALAATKNDAFE